jgi:hypothetical protein
MAAKISKENFLTEIRLTYAEWQALISQIKPQEMNEPLQPGGWTLKDVIAHISWHEREMLEVIRSRALVGSELWELPTDERNAVIYEIYRPQPIHLVLVEATKTHADLVPALETLSDDELNDASHFVDMPPDWIPGELIASNTSEHYREHTPEVQAWLANKS